MAAFVELSQENDDIATLLRTSSHWHRFETERKDFFPTKISFFLGSHGEIVEDLRFPKFLQVFRSHWGPKLRQKKSQVFHSSCDSQTFLLPNEFEICINKLNILLAILC